MARDVTYAMKQAQVDRGNLVISTGSSIIAQGITSTGARYGFDVVGPVEWAQVLTRQRFQYKNQGVSGQNSREIFGRLKKDVLQYNPAAVIVQNGTNEIGEGWESIWANSEPAYKKILDSGAHLILCAINPRTSGGGWDDDNRRNALQLNEMKRRFCQNNPRAYYADWSLNVTDPSSTAGLPVTAKLRDGTHWSAQGAHSGALILKPILEHIFPETSIYSPSYLDEDADNLIHGVVSVVPTLLGTSGTLGTGASGTVPTGWRLERNNDDDASGTVAGASTTPASDASDPQISYEMTFTPGGGTTENFYLRTQSANTALPDADGLYEALCDIEVDAWDHFKQITLEADDQGTGNKTIACFHNIQDQPMPTEAWSGIMKTPIFKTDGDVRLRLRVIIDGQGSGTGVIRLKNIQVRRVDPDNLPEIYDSYDNGSDNKAFGT